MLIYTFCLNRHVSLGHLDITGYLYDDRYLCQGCESEEYAYCGQDRSVNDAHRRDAETCHYKTYTYYQADPKWYGSLRFHSLVDQKVIVEILLTKVRK